MTFLERTGRKDEFLLELFRIVNRSRNRNIFNFSESEQEVLSRYRNRVGVCKM